MVSLPDFDPNNPKEAHDPDRINRLTTGVFEMGSTFKALTLAMALDSGKANLNTLLRCARRAALRQIHHPRLPSARPLDHAVGSVHLFLERRRGARCARRRASRRTRRSCRRWASSTGCAPNCRRAPSPIVPKRWGELNTITIAFGHGMSVAPLQAVMGINALVNGGYLIPPTFMKRTRGRSQRLAKRVIKPETSEKMRYLMRLNAENGTAKQGRRQGLLRRRQDRHLGEGGRRPLFQEAGCSTPSPRSCRPTIRNISC